MLDSASPAAAATSPDAELIDLLRARGQRVTSQRLVILRELRRRDRHVTAETIRTAVSEDLPGISAPTVYATLDLLVELGLARKLDVGTGVSLFDGRIAPHQHTVCRICRRVEDLDAPFDETSLAEAAERGGFTPDHVEVVLTGICPDCASA